jgi:hypothetical protein
MVETGQCGDSSAATNCELFPDGHKDPTHQSTPPSSLEPSDAQKACIIPHPLNSGLITFGRRMADRKADSVDSRDQAALIGRGATPAALLFIATPLRTNPITTAEMVTKSALRSSPESLTA